MKSFTDRVIRNPFTTLIGIAFAVAGILILKWSDHLSEASRIFLCILCFSIAITGLGWRDKAFFKVIEYFKKRANLLLILSFSIGLFGVSSCIRPVSKRQIYELLLELKTQMDVQNNSNQIYLYENQKKAIDSDFENISHDDLLRSINELVPPKSTPKPKL